MKTKVSVIIPAYNESAAIGPCLTALLRQDGAVYGQDYEIIVVDDASTDNTASKAAAFPVKVVRSPDNRGRVDARK
ncbi:MAG: glycosyltransferase, partial [Candidatus Omnitrophica bacterium]|nr:glycosyltransferase [Candidatus Omnitrophota bacterium]